MANVFVPDDIDFGAYEQETEAQQKVRPASTWVQDMISRYKAPQEKVQRGLMPWGKTHNLIQFRPGEVTLWGGINGHGKSLVTGMVGLSLCSQNEPCCIASFEMKPAKTLERMGRQFAMVNPEAQRHVPGGVKRMVDLYEQFSGWSDGKLWLYDQQGTVAWSKVCGVARYAAKELGIKHIFIDSLMKCVQGEDDYNGQKAFVDSLTAIARDNNIHIHLIHHVKKLANEEARPSKYDMKGSGAITDLVDNVISVWRNKPKERKREEKKMTEEMEQTMPDALLICDKQRNGEWEGQIALWFDKQSQQYLAKHDGRPIKIFIEPTE